MKIKCLFCGHDAEIPDAESFPFCDECLASIETVGLYPSEVETILKEDRERRKEEPTCRRIS
jgi:endogenous inhibitor of DNA gyrase (YacG/DUF329 family)